MNLFLSLPFSLPFSPPNGFLFSLFLRFPS
nr:MAG TPA: hypothetical protein [Caudoviricetes sp.]